ncbi:MAG: M23 family metallopeptidase, partial [Sphaerochaetaceae bacterium]|nr:M23 family metallopeptidase [Sphaerochaetaceae bacterium]
MSRTRGNVSDDSNSTKLLVITIVLAVIVCGTALLIWLAASDSQPNISEKNISPRRTVSEDSIASGDDIASSLIPSDRVLFSSENITERGDNGTENSLLSADSQVPLIVEEKNIIEKSVTEQEEFSVPAVARPLSVSQQSYRPADPVQFTEYKVKENDSVASVAQSFGLRTQTVISVNSLKTVYPSVGSILFIPNLDGQIYTVSQGDTFFSIAQKFSLTISWRTLKEINALGEDDSLHEGMKLFIPYTESVYEESLQISEETMQAKRSFISPVKDGTLLYIFDQKINDLLTDQFVVLDGVVYQAAEEADVVASESGIVVDRGFNSNNTGFLKISHDSGYTTFYDYMSSVTVNVGEHVEKGSV